MEDGAAVYLARGTRLPSLAAAAAAARAACRRSLRPAPGQGWQRARARRVSVGQAACWRRATVRRGVEGGRPLADGGACGVRGARSRWRGREAVSGCG